MEITEISMFIIETGRHREETVYEKEQEICLHRADHRITATGSDWIFCDGHGQGRENAGTQLSPDGVSVLRTISVLSVFPDSL